MATKEWTVQDEILRQARRERVVRAALELGKGGHTSPSGVVDLCCLIYVVTDNGHRLPVSQIDLFTIDGPRLFHRREDGQITTAVRVDRVKVVERQFGIDCEEDEL